MAEADVFGEFTFSSAFDPNPHRDRQSDDFDDWGDFVTDSSSSPIKTNRFGSPADPFGFFNVSDGAASLTSSPEKKTSNSNSSQWEKPKGALPLSLFGEEEREEKASQDLTGLTKNEGLERKASNLNGVGVGVGNNYLISNMYVQNGLNSNLSSNVFDSKLNGLDGVNVSLNSNGFEFEGLVSNGSLNSNAAKSNVEEGSGDFDDDDDDGWEFNAAESESIKEQGVVEVAELKPESSTVVHRGFQDNVGRPGFSGGFGIHAHELNNVSVPSQGTPHGNGQWGFHLISIQAPQLETSFSSTRHIQKAGRTVLQVFPICLQLMMKCGNSRMNFRTLDQNLSGKRKSLPLLRVQTSTH